MLGISLPCSTVWVVISVVSCVRRFTGVVNTYQFQQYLGTVVITEYLVVNQSDKVCVLISTLGMENKQMKRLHGKRYHERMRKSEERPLQRWPIRHFNKNQRNWERASHCRNGKGTKIEDGKGGV